MWWETGTFSFFLAPFSIHISNNVVFPLYIFCVVNGGNALFFFLFWSHTHMYIIHVYYTLCVGVCVEDIYTHTYSIYNIWGDFLWKINHEHSWCICKTTMYVQYACKCCPGVARVHLTLSALSFLLT